MPDGRGSRRALVDVVLPLMRPGILAGMLFAFIVSFNEFTVTFFLYSIDTMTLPVWLYSRTVSSLDPTVFCFAVFTVAIDFALIWMLENSSATRVSRSDAHAAPPSCKEPS